MSRWVMDSQNEEEELKDTWLPQGGASDEESGEQ